MLIFDDFFGFLVELGVTLLVTVVYYKWTFQYWKKKNVPFLEPSIPFGSMGNPFTRKVHNGVRFKKLYDEMKAQGWKHGGLYSMIRPVYFVLDLDYVKNIMAKDFQHFTDRGVDYDEKTDPLSAHLFSIGGEKWSNLRTELTPPFTSGKMKMMFETLSSEPSLWKKIQSNCSQDEAIDTMEVHYDFMQLLIDLKNNKLDTEDEDVKHDGKSLTIEEVAVQNFGFFIAGFETSSTTMTFALYELSKHQQIQEKLRKEINDVLAKHDGKITYEAIQEMKYMDQVINETLRKYPPVPILSRRCVKDYKIPDQNVIIEEETRVFISVLGIHYDKEYYPDPEKFDPERFSEENKRTRHSYAHIPFGEGPRICIGMRFGLMQSKVGLTSLLSRYRFTVNRKTQEPIKMKVRSFVLAAEGGIWLNANKL